MAADLRASPSAPRHVSPDALAPGSHTRMGGEARLDGVQCACTTYPLAPDGVNKRSKGTGFTTRLRGRHSRCLKHTLDQPTQHRLAQGCTSCACSVIPFVGSVHTTLEPRPPGCAALSRNRVDELQVLETHALQILLGFHFTDLANVLMRIWCD